jgi:hypothetical protein
VREWGEWENKKNSFCSAASGEEETKMPGPEMWKRGPREAGHKTLLDFDVLWHEGLIMLKLEISFPVKDKLRVLIKCWLICFWNRALNCKIIWSTQGQSESLKCTQPQLYMMLAKMYGYGMVRRSGFFYPTHCYYWISTFYRCLILPIISNVWATLFCVPPIWGNSQCSAACFFRKDTSSKDHFYTLHFPGWSY